MGHPIFGFFFQTQIGFFDPPRRQAPDRRHASLCSPPAHSTAASGKRRASPCCACAPNRRARRTARFASQRPCAPLPHPRRSARTHRVRHKPAHKTAVCSPRRCRSKDGTMLVEAPPQAESSRPAGHHCKGTVATTAWPRKRSVRTKATWQHGSARLPRRPSRTAATSADQPQRHTSRPAARPPRRPTPDITPAKPPLP